MRQEVCWKKMQNNNEPAREEVQVHRFSYGTTLLLILLTVFVPMVLLGLVFEALDYPYPPSLPLTLLSIIFAEELACYGPKPCTGTLTRLMTRFPSIRDRVTLTLALVIFMVLIGVADIIHHFHFWLYIAGFGAAVVGGTLFSFIFGTRSLREAIVNTLRIKPPRHED